MWADTGFLYAAAGDEQLFTLFLERYGARLHVASLVGREIRTASVGLPGASEADKAKRVAAKSVLSFLKRHEIEFSEPLAEQSALFDKIRAQLSGLEDAKTDSSLATASATRTVQDTFRHAGEAASIVEALTSAGGPRRAVLLTNDGGASIVAEDNGITCRHLANIYAEIACHYPNLQAEDLHASFERCTDSVGAVPDAARPDNVRFYRCAQIEDGFCITCKSDIEKLRRT